MKLVSHKYTGKLFAMKILSKREVIAKGHIGHTREEIRILELLDNPFFVQFKEMVQDRKFIYLIMEFVEGGNVFRFLASQKQLNEKTVQFMIGQVVLMLEHLHNKGILYRDLKPENLLIDRRGYLKLIDFGLSKQTSSRTYTVCGTPEYLAPEVLLQKGHGKAVDWWCVGNLMYELLVGVSPFSSDDPMEIYENIL